MCTAGLYLLSAGIDKLLVLWDVIQRKPICKRSAPATVSALSWHPHDNEVACFSEAGSIATWKGLVPEDFPGPHVSPDSLHKDGSVKEGDGERGGSVDPLGE